MPHFIFTGTCILCGATSNNRLDLCTACENELPWIKHACTRCAYPLENNQPLCGNCSANPPPFIQTVALCHYQEPITHLILGLKFATRLNCGNLLGELMAKRLALHYLDKDKPEVIIPVPLHAKRLQERGYNQALEIARPIAKKLKIKIDKFSYYRKKQTEAQTELPASLRYQNVRGAFAAAKELSYKHVAIVDDVITTGNTITEFCKMLKKARVKKIDVWCCAKTKI